MDWASLPEWAKFISALAAIATGLAVIWSIAKAIARALVRCAGEIEYMLSQRKIHEEIDKKLDVILGELKSNGGLASGGIERRQCAAR